MMTAIIWCVSFSDEDDLPGRLGDARELADRCGAKVGVVRFDTGESTNDSTARRWIEQGADEIQILSLPFSSASNAVDSACSIWNDRPPQCVITPADRTGREFSARLAARAHWKLLSPVLMLQWKNQRMLATRVNESGRRAQLIELPLDRPAIVGIRPGVAQPIPADGQRTGIIKRRKIQIDGERRILSCRHQTADPRTCDIRHVPKLIAGGKGVGSKDGFNILKRVAEKLGAGIAASRMAVDLGWIEHERQVGQTGKTVRPELYIACGISGASHHLDGMSESQKIVAINTDPHAPLMQKAELALQADLHATLAELDDLLEGTA